MDPAPSPPPALPKRLSLVAQTTDSLREGILAGHWQHHLPGERELCESLQVSRRTLRAALDELQRQGLLGVSGRKRRTIHSRNIARRAVKGGKASGAKVIGILTAGSFLALPSPISFVVDTLRSKLTAAGYLVQLHVQPACYTTSPAHALARLVADHPATVWLIVSAQEPTQRWFSRQQLTCLILGSCAPGITLPSVDVDYHASCHHAGGLLWRKGHRRIAFILAKGVYGGDIASEDGLREALKDMPDTHLQVIRHNTSAAHLCTLIDECLRSPRPPTAYVVTRAHHVLTVMMHLMRRGRRIPQDAAVISRDNDPILDATSPTVARYTIQPVQLASRIVHAVRQLAETRILSSSAIRLMPAFVPGESA
jgi:DNA-binding LacI/PurR family transcriptional regulator